MQRLLQRTGQRNVQDFDPGLIGYDKVQIAEEDTNPKKKTTTYELQPGKRLWDWLQLLLIPFVLFFVAYTFNSYQSSTSQQIEEKSKQEQVIDNYLNQMSTILLQYNLHASKPGDPIRALAQAFTLAALDRLDSEHKNMLILFLYRADLLKYHYYNHKETDCGDPKALKKQFPVDEKPIITLSQGHIEGVTINNLGLSCIDLHNMEMEGANFSESDLNRADVGLSFAMNADFSYTSMIAANMYFLDLENANLQGAHLQTANMKGICLSHARLDGANLQGADLTVFHHLISQTVLYCGQYLTSSGILDNRLSPIPANLSGAVLTNANLTGANLSGANLSHTKVSPEQLAEATLQAGTIKLSGSKRP